MIFGQGDIKLPYKKKEVNGSVVSFDLDTEKLKIYYSKNSPQGAYDIIKRHLIKNGFVHQKDSDYLHLDMDIEDTAKVILKFAQTNKWFPLCVNKVNVVPNVKTRDLLPRISEYLDIDYQKEKEDEALQEECKHKHRGIGRQR